ncbi:MAG: HAD-IIB family hydrolase [Nitrospiraceae bacterium]
MEQNIASKNLRGAKRTLIIFTDLDGTLLDSVTYSFDAAREALVQLLARSIPVIIVSSKTRSEIEPLRFQIHNEHPFIVENGGAVVVPSDYFPFPLTGAVTSGHYQVVGLGTPYPLLRAALKEVEKELGRELRGYGDMSVDEIAARTGLSRQEAELAKQRDYDEPFIMEGPGCREETVVEAITTRALSCTK